MLKALPLPTQCLLMTKKLLIPILTSSYNWFMIEHSVKNPSARVMRVSQKIGKDQLLYFQQRGIDHQRVLAAMIFRFCREIFNKLPDEFGAEVNQLIGIKLEGSVG
ncbi:hypothetical protein IGI04_006977 [Brassica rapa subsp. trilocularis]|uniref:Uncharacterized protein n=1 Tax=Brassica rapa subsp. trilocularis TaxID=1813537 RepID=A0ABQ7NIE6_BRACM|nr:hypothetical protein IGI04_006977 [Brassica rapa subsp. trilocularis]